MGKTELNHLSPYLIIHWFIERKKKTKTCAKLGVIFCRTMALCTWFTARITKNMPLWLYQYVPYHYDILVYCFLRGVDMLVMNSLRTWITQSSFPNTHVKYTVLTLFYHLRDTGYPVTLNNRHYHFTGVQIISVWKMHQAIKHSVPQVDRMNCSLVSTKVAGSYWTISLLLCSDITNPKCTVYYLYSY